jgi:hypothetical protein
MPFGIPDATDIEKAAEQAEDHLLVVLTQFRKELIADLERILDERSIVVTFPKKLTAPKPTNQPQ